jgi:hypothetical protein
LATPIEKETAMTATLKTTGRKINKATVKVHSYTRFSTPEQSQGDSERRQIDAAGRWAKRNGYTIDDSLRMTDNGLSGYKGPHRTKGKFGEFLAAVEAGKVPEGSILVVENIDRVGREGPKKMLQQIIFKLHEHGVTLQTTDPEETYEPGCENEVKFLILILRLQQAWDESAKKSKRIRESWDAWRARVANGEKAPPPGRMPPWVCWNLDPRVPQKERKFLQNGTFSLVEPAAAAVRKIFRWAADGLGARAIVARLNGPDGVAPIGRTKAWRISYVAKLLVSREVLGELTDVTGRTYPRFYPACVKEAEFYRARSACSARKIGKEGVGRTGAGVPNLFAGLTRDAESGSPLHYIDKGERGGGLKLVAAAGLRGEPGANIRAIPYVQFESAVLQGVEELSPADITGEADDTADKRAELDGRCRDLEHRIAKGKKAADTAEDVTAILDLLAKWERELNEAKAARESLKAAAARDPEDDLENSLRLVRLVRNAEGEERVELRERLRSKLLSLLGGIWVWVFDVSANVRALMAQLVFRSGRVKIVNLVWVRRGKWAGACTTWKLVAAEPGETHHKGKLLSEYASDPATRAWFAGHRERMTPSILEIVRNVLATLEVPAKAKAKADKERAKLERKRKEFDKRVRLAPKKIAKLVKEHNERVRLATPEELARMQAEAAEQLRAEEEEVVRLTAKAAKVREEVARERELAAEANPDKENPGLRNRKQRAKRIRQTAEELAREEEKA